MRLLLATIPLPAQLMQTDIGYRVRTVVCETKVYMQLQFLSKLWRGKQQRLHRVITGIPTILFLLLLLPLLLLMS